MILSASRRTDIPCYYAEWFVNRLKAGYVLVRNPMNPAQMSRIPLSPDLVDCIVFWTKDAQHILPHLTALDRMGYHYYFQFTLTPYDCVIEPGLRSKTEIEDTFIELSKRIGRERVVWRYDPIILNDTLDIAYHKAQFERLCDKLCGGGPQPLYTNTVTVSFVDLYPKLKTPLIREITAEEMEELGSYIGRTAKGYGLAVGACCEKAGLSGYGMERASCIDKALIEKIIGCPLDILPDKNQREGCGCCESMDIGAYNTCPNGCIYCYATDGAASAERRYRAHNPDSELLTGRAAEGEKITERKVKSHKREQMELF